MKNIFKKLSLLAVLALSLSVSSPIYSKPSSGSSSSWGSSSSSRSSSGSSWGSSSKSSSGSSWGSSSKSSSPSYSSPSKSSGSSGSSTGSWGSSDKSSSSASSYKSGTTDSSWSSKPSPAPIKTPKRSVVDEAAYSKAAKSGTAFTSRTEAVTSYQTKYKSTYVNNFVVEPSVRPTHIPTTYLVGGISYPIIYGPSYRGYGYYIGSTWYAYDVWRDAAMLSILMHNDGYYYDTNYTYNYPNSGSGHPFLLLVFGLLVVIIVVAIIINA